MDPPGTTNTNISCTANQQKIFKHVMTSTKKSNYKIHTHTSNNNKNNNKRKYLLVFIVVAVVFVTIQNYVIVDSLITFDDNKNNNNDVQIIMTKSSSSSIPSTMRRATAASYNPRNNNNGGGDDNGIITDTAQVSSTTTTTTKMMTTKAAATRKDVSSTAAAAATATNNHQNNQNKTSASILELSMLHDLPHPDMRCSNSDDENIHDICCVSWKINVDKWRIHHPDWKIVLQNSTQQCFSKYSEPQATFFRKLYKRQWYNNNNNDTTDNYNDNAMDIYQRNILPPSSRDCSNDNLYQNYQIFSGAGATIPIVLGGLYNAYVNNRPYQISKRTSLIRGNHWMYISQNKSSWSWCKTRDLRCFILPLGNCKPIYGDEVNGIDNCPQCRINPNKNNANLIVQYGLRLKHELRHKIQILTDTFLSSNKGTKMMLKKNNNCSVVHVRRGDKGIALPPYNRYAGLLEYVHAGKLTQNESILLLADDVTTIVEADRYFPDYNFIYMDIPRTNMSKFVTTTTPIIKSTNSSSAGGSSSSTSRNIIKGGVDVRGSRSAGWDSHMNYKDPSDDFVALLTEIGLAARYCNKLVHGDTHFVELILIGYMLERKPLPQKFYFKTSITKEEANKYDNISHTERARLYIDTIYNEAEQALQDRQKSE